MAKVNSAPELPESGGPMPQKPVVKLPDPIPPKDGVSDVVSEINEELVAELDDTDRTSIETVADDIELDGPDEVISDELTEPLEDEAGLEPGETVGPQETLTAPELTEDSVPDDPLTVKAVDEIVAEEGDAVLAAEDEKREFEAAPEPAKPKSKIGEWLGNLWANPKSRWGILAGTAVLLLAAALVPHSRYFILNTAQVRASLELKVIDGGTLQPLKNVTVRAGGAEGKTDGSGAVKLEKVRLGRTTLHIEKRAFSPTDRDITVGWGSNPLGEFRATAVGTQYTILVKDALSDKPITGAEAASGEGNASSDQDGKIVLTLDTAEQDDAAQISVQISAGSYRSETLNITVNNKETQSVSMVPSRKHVFVSKRSGNYDVYTVDIDGKNEQRIVGGTGLERDDITLVPHQQKEVAALVSTRENTRNSSGYLLSTLYVLDTRDGELTKIDQSEQIQIVGWSKSGRLVYVKIAAGASGTDPKRHRLMSFNSEDFSDTKELASSNSFNDVVMADDRVYYAPSNIFQENPTPAMYGVNPDGTSSQMVLDREVFTILRSSYDKLDLSVGQDWYSYALGSSEAAKPGTAPSSQYSKVFADNSHNNFSLWVDSRDGKGVLLSYDKSTKQDMTLASRGGLKLPAYWLNDKYAVYRVSDGKETADYVINIEGGEAKKITDVTDTAGIGRWFYY